MVFSFSNMARKLGSAFGGSSEESILGIDIGASSAKIVQLRASHGAAILETYGEISLGPYGKQPIGKVASFFVESID